ncbi:MAG: sulfate permease [Deltaproteobacteria bacterium]|nr:sulfate permease [Deltaproteobacteria bacterium]
MDAARRTTLLRNLLAGTTTAVVIIPQGMAYSLVAGLEPIHGLYASLLPLVAYALIGRSRELAVGPGALDTLLVGASLSTLAFVTPETHAGYAALLALQVAAIQLLLGALRAGYLVNFLSAPVLSGFTSAAAITIALSQVGNLLGFKLDATGYTHEIAHQIVTRVSSTSPLTAAFGLVAIVLLVLGKKRVPRAPYALGVVALATVVSALTGVADDGVAIVGGIPQGLPTPTLPPLSWDTFVALLPTAITIAFVGYLTMITIAKHFAEKHRYDISPDRELLGAGAANLMAALTQGFPVSASFSRSAVHAAAGSTSRFTLLVVAGWVALTLLLLTGLLHDLPKAILAAIIITAVYGLIDVKTFKRLRKVKPIDAWVLVVTFVATLAVGIETGILVGALASLGVFLFESTRPHTAVLGRIGASPDFRNVKNHPDAITYPGLVIIRIDAQFYFGNVTFLKAFLRRIEAEAAEPVRAIILEACSFTQLDSSAEAALSAIVDDYEARGVRFMIASVKVPVLKVMKASGLYDKLGPDRFFMNVDDAVRAWTGDRADGDVRR